MEGVPVHQYALGAPMSSPDMGPQTLRATTPHGQVRGVIPSVPTRASQEVAEFPSNAQEAMGSENRKLLLRRLEHLETIPTLSNAPGSDKPSKISSWLQLIHNILSPAGEDASTWWSWTAQVAREAHVRLMSVSQIERSSVQVEVRTPLRYQEVERFLRPPITKLLAAEVKARSLRRAVPALGMQHYLFQAFKEYPGGAADKHFVLQQLRFPGTATSPQGALTLLRKWLDLPERARELGVAWQSSQNVLRLWTRL